MKKILYALLFLPLCSCHIGYIASSAYHQAKMLRSRVPVEQVLENPDVDQGIKNKLKLAQEAKDFAEKRLKLDKTKNYNSYVDLKRPYVTYVVSAAPKNELTHYTWYFPIVGSVPYKGYFVEAEAKEEAEKLKNKDLDVFVRGVSAFSTLGWFADPILSSMMRYSDYDLVNTIIHETVHATLYISSSVDFNERLANYLGNLGTQIFYEEKGPQGLRVLEQVKTDLHDQKLFSEYISQKIKDLKKWYKDHGKDESLLVERQQQFAQIQKDYSTEVLPKLKSDRYKNFDKVELNNARLLEYKLYMNDLSDFEKLTNIFNKDFDKILAYCKSLEDEKDPEATLKKFVQLSK